MIGDDFYCHKGHSADECKCREICGDCGLRVYECECLGASD